MNLKHLIIFLPLFLALGCDIFNDSGEDDVVVKAYQSKIWIVNHLENPVYYTAFEQEILALIDWAPCVTPDGCPGISPDDSVILEPDSVVGYREPGEVVVVYWWQLTPEPGDSTWRVTNLRSKAVKP